VFYRVGRAPIRCGAAPGMMAQRTRR